jgi:3-deoxy-D-manno-octulosonic-acid transferase
MFLLYSLLYTIAVIFLLPFEYLKRPKDIRKRWLREKFGFINPAFSKSTHPSIKPGQGGIIWVHAVSVGEVMASLPLLKGMKSRYPGKRIVLSTITDTGQKVAKERAPEGTEIVYLPFDIPLVLNKVLDVMTPDLLIIIETELWPNLLRIFKERGIPVALMNGRISEKSFGGYKKISFFMKKVLSFVDVFCMQAEEYALRIINLGVDSSRVEVSGNFKFDTRPPSKPPDWTQDVGRPAIVAGSTYEGEEQLLLSVYEALKKDFPNLNLIIAPRHPERFQGVEDLLRSNNVSFIKRSESGTPGFPQRAEGKIILLDTVGELPAVYSIADIAIIGKSFRGKGGQNPLEPAFWGKPVVCGPHMENFPVIRDFMEAGAAVMVQEGGLYSQLIFLLRTPERAEEIGSKARDIYRKNSGAVEKALKIIEPYLGIPPG